MKYQIVQHLKTKTKKLAVLETAHEARKFIESLGARFSEYSYIGDFPVYVDGHKTYTVQGLVLPINIVCSLPKKDRALWA